MHEAKAPGVHVNGPDLLSRKRSPPEPSHQRHPSKPHQQRAFTGGPRRCKTVLERKFFSSEGCNVQHRGVVDQEQTGKGDKGEGHGQVKDNGKHRLVLVKPWLDQEPCGGDEGQPHRDPPHGHRVMGDRQRALVNPHGWAFLTTRRISPASNQRRGAQKSRAWSATTGA